MLSDKATERQRRILNAFGFDESRPAPPELSLASKRLAASDMDDEHFDLTVRFLGAFRNWTDAVSLMQSVCGTEH